MAERGLTATVLVADNQKEDSRTVFGNGQKVARSIRKPFLNLLMIAPAPAEHGGQTRLDLRALDLEVVQMNRRSSGFIAN